MGQGLYIIKIAATVQMDVKSLVKKRCEMRKCSRYVVWSETGMGFEMCVQDKDQEHVCLQCVAVCVTAVH